jgi:hypothetical protein
MLTLREALDAVKSITDPSSRFSHQKIRIDGDTLYAFNGQVVARATFAPALLTRAIVVDAGAFGKVWADGARVVVEGDKVTVLRRRTRYTLPLMNEDQFDCPGIMDGGEYISELTRSAILMASKFASENAVHPWACGVTFRNQRVVATNNILVVSVECDSEFEGTLPFWAVNTLRKDGALPKLRMGETSLTFTYDDGVTFQSALLAVEMPPKLFDLVAELDEATVPVAPLADVLDEVFALGGRHCTINPILKTVQVDTETGFSAHADFDNVDTYAEAITIQEVSAEIVLRNATHIGFAGAPKRLTFSRNVMPRFRGLAAAMVM